MTIMDELTKINAMLQQAHDEGRSLTEEDWAKLDAELEAARAAAHR